MSRLSPFTVHLVLMIPIFILFSSCKTVSDNKSLIEGYYEKAAEYLEEEKYSQLRKIAERILLLNKNEYTAAYYKALAMVKMDYQKGIPYYLDYIRSYSAQMPDEFKRKWIDLVQNIHYKGIELDTENLEVLHVSVPLGAGESDLNRSKVILSGSDLFFLNTKGEFYKINLDSLQRKKLNYYRTNDFIISGQSVIFNDSINLLKYEYQVKKYNLIKSFETVNIKFVKHNNTKNNSVIQNIIDETTNLYFYNIKKDQIVELPEDCIDQSSNLQFFVRKVGDNYKIFDIIKEENFDIPGTYLGFYNNDSIFTYQNGFVYSYVLASKELSMLFYYDNAEEIEACFYKNDKLIVVLKDSFILMNYDYTHLNYLEGTIIQMNKHGILYKTPDADGRLSYIRYDNDYEIYRINADVNNLVLSENDSNYFADIKGAVLQIYDLKKIGEKKRR